MSKRGGGDCFQVAMEIMLSNMSTASILLCHGYPRGTGDGSEGKTAKDEPFAHAWIEVPCANLVLDFSNGHQGVIEKSIYYHVGKIDDANVRRYTHEQMSVETIRHGNYGIWHHPLETTPTGDTK